MNYPVVAGTGTVTVAPTYYNNNHYNNYNNNNYNSYTNEDLPSQKVQSPSYNNGPFNHSVNLPYYGLNYGYYNNQPRYKPPYENYYPYNPQPENSDEIPNNYYATHHYGNQIQSPNPNQAHYNHNNGLVPLVKNGVHPYPHHHFPPIQTGYSSTNNKIQKTRHSIYDRFMNHLRNRRHAQRRTFMPNSLMQMILFPASFFAFTMMLMDFMRLLLPQPPSIPSLLGLDWDPTPETTTTTRAPKFTRIEINPPKIPGPADVLGEVIKQVVALKELKYKSKQDKNKKKKKKKWEEDDDSDELYYANYAGRRRRLKPSLHKRLKGRRNNNANGEITAGESLQQIQQYYNKTYKKRKKH